MQQKFMVTVGVHEAEGSVQHKQPGGQERSTTAIDKSAKHLGRYETMASKGATARAARFEKRLAKFDARPSPRTAAAQAKRAVKRALIVAASQDMSGREIKGHFGAMTAERDLQRWKAQRERNIAQFGEKSRAAPSLLEIAGYHEFGFGVPRRSFIADWYDQNEVDARHQLHQLASEAIQGHEPLKTSLTKFGAWAVGSIQARIATHIQPELAASTIRQKHGKAVPLINTGQLRSSIRARVKVGT
jgi:hypothetical protein